ncbi:MAG: TonB-dependent receptor [Pyrinomonadaceae bacterium]|nr:TonB-dependent receptor [Pyrinomonadaceae bacterium]
MKRIIASLFLGLLLGLSSAYSQGTTATLSGTVSDEDGAAVPDAIVTVRNDGIRWQRETTTNSAGDFTLSFLPPGRYAVKAARQGFLATEIKDMALEVGAQLSLKIALKPAGPAESVTVTAASAINTAPSVSTLINRQFVESLPMNGRSFQSLIILTPGVVLTKTGFGEQGQFSVNGQRSNANYFTVDGVSANIQISGSATLNQTAGGSIPGGSAGGGTISLVSIDALQEFRIQTSTYAPEYGRSPGAQVSIVTRSGTNEFHGTLFEYFRNDALDANDWFNNSLGLAKPATRQNNFGGVFGGPVLLPRFGEGGKQPWYDGHNRTFFFFSYEGLRLRQPQTRITDVPTVSVRQSALPQVRPYLNAYPLPNGPVTDTTRQFARFAASYSDPSSANAASVRLDHFVNSKLTINGRYNYAPSELQTRAIDNTSVNAITVQAFKTETATVSATWLASPRITNELRVNWSRNQSDWISHLDGFGGAVPLPESAWFPSSVDAADSLIVFGIGGTQSSFYVGKNVANKQQQFNLVNDLSFAAGSHQLKLGVDFRQLLPSLGIRSYAQFLNFNGATGLAAGRTHATTNSNLETWDPAPLKFNNFSLYAQDTWRARSRLTLTYGLRWEVNPPPTPRDGKQLYAIRGVENLATATVAPGPLYKTQYANVAPRIGAAYALSQRPGWELTLRGGVGVFYDMGNGPAGNVAGSFPNSGRAPFLNRLYPLSPSDAAPPVLTGNLPVGAAGFRGFDADLKLPRVYQWNLAFEQSLGSQQTLWASYIGAVGRRLLRVDFIALPLTVNPNIGANINFTRNTASSDYHALQVQFQRRLSRGLQALASYSWSHSIDNGSSDASSFVRADLVNPRIDRGNSDFDVRHAFTTAVTYNIPKLRFGKVGEAILRDWAIDNIFVARSATPLNLTTGVANLFNVQPRPNVIQGVALYLFDASLPGGKRFNRAAFANPIAGQQGSFGRNVLRAFPAWQLDFAMRRQFNITERVNLQLKAEMFNILNHPNFGDPISRLTSASFGLSDRTLARTLSSGGGAGFNSLYQIGGPRSMQLVLKIHF